MVFKIQNKGMNKFVNVISNGKTQHLEKVINKQKSKVVLKLLYYVFRIN